MMKFDKYLGQTLDMYECANFLGSDIYGSFFKEHGRFYSFFGQNGQVALVYLELYFIHLNMGILMNPTHKKNPELIPHKCCGSGSGIVCRSSTLRNRLFEIIDLASKDGGQIPEIDLWHYIDESDTPCFLKDWAQFQFTLFELLELHRIEISSRSENSRSFRRYNEVKRGPGRPKKY